MLATRVARSGTALSLAALFLLTACSLVPGPAPVPRYFAPEFPATAAAPVSEPVSEPAPLLLRPVTASRHLGDRIAWCDGGVEYGYYDLLRWTRPPAESVDDALDRVLFESGRFERARHSGATTLEVTLLAFEERRGEPHEVLLEVSAVLTDGQGATLLDRRFGGTHALAGDDPADIPRAMGPLMAEVLGELAEAVTEQDATQN